MGIFNRSRRRKETQDGQMDRAAEGMGDMALTEPRYNGVGAFERPIAGDLMIDESLIRPVIGADQVREAMRTLRKYKAGKANFQRRIIENEEFWKLRHWEYMNQQGTTGLKTKSAWLVNVLLSKHADAMDAIPEPNFLPREPDDEGEAAILSQVFPVILSRNDFDETWSDNQWKKLKAGVCFYGVFWDRDKLNGLGDISITAVDPLNLYWEPGIRKIQDSRNLFLVEWIDNDILKEQYPELDEKALGARTFNEAKYLYDDSVDMSGKSPVIDWYYKKQAGGRTVLHFVKFVGESVLYATENVPELTDRGLYDHGLYPIEADVLFPEEGTPTGFGYVDICKDPQRQIDLMNNAIVANCVAAATPRWLKRGEDGINEEEYADWTRPFVHVQGSIEENALRQITVTPLSGNYLSILEAKVNEIKETSGNRDVNNGGTPSGVTAASAIAAMQEQSGKLSRDQINVSYRTFRNVCYMAISLIRQFYDAPRKMRITGASGATQYIAFDNKGLTNQPVPAKDGREPTSRMPEFDIEVTAQKQNPYSKLSYNELALQLYGVGFFNPGQADPALAALEMMDFKGREEVIKRVADNGTMFQAIQQLTAELTELRAFLGISPPMQGGGAPGGAGRPAAAGPAGRLPDNDAIGEQRRQNRYVDKARNAAQAATQPR